jgi:hypothetical protein
MLKFSKLNEINSHLQSTEKVRFKDFAAGVPGGTNFVYSGLFLDFKNYELPSNVKSGKLNLGVIGQNLAAREL